jgi:hypothetical protein
MFLSLDFISFLFYFDRIIKLTMFLLSHVPLAMTCADNTFELDGQVTPFPGLPVFAAYIVKFLLGRRYSGAWEFAPSDFTGRPRLQQASL